MKKWSLISPVEKALAALIGAGCLTTALISGLLLAYQQHAYDQAVKRLLESALRHLVADVTPLWANGDDLGVISHIQRFRREFEPCQAIAITNEINAILVHSQPDQVGKQLPAEAIQNSWRSLTRRAMGFRPVWRSFTLASSPPTRLSFRMALPWRWEISQQALWLLVCGILISGLLLGLTVLLLSRYVVLLPIHGNDLVSLAQAQGYALCKKNQPDRPPKPDPGLSIKE